MNEWMMLFSSRRSLFQHEFAQDLQTMMIFLNPKLIYLFIKWERSSLCNISSRTNYFEKLFPTAIYVLNVINFNSFYFSLHYNFMRYTHLGQCIYTTKILYFQFMSHTYWIDESKVRYSGKYWTKWVNVMRTDIGLIILFWEIRLWRNSSQ